MNAGLDADRGRALALTPVSPEVEKRLEKFVALLLETQAHTNLIAASTIPVLWTRHIADSLQLLKLAPDARMWIDLGSGAGFPGLVIACALTVEPDAKIHLVESVGKKAAFLREAVRVTGAPAIVEQKRIENIGDSLGTRADVITARAVAPLKLLLDQVHPLMGPKTLALLHKGQDVEAELTEASKYWSIEADLVPSLTSPQGRIVVVRHLVARKTVA
ncbi:MAG: 16S rRNA (guanine(527)-N(7))-methyltransferase RsmG [Hyphomicrobiales bacterium]